VTVEKIPDVKSSLGDDMIEPIKEETMKVYTVHLFIDTHAGVISVEQDYKAFKDKADAQRYCDMRNLAHEDEFAGVAEQGDFDGIELLDGTRPEWAVVEHDVT
jgi:hypothetical protein